VSLSAPLDEDTLVLLFVSRPLLLDEAVELKAASSGV
jgi:hypothetical protein